MVDWSVALARAVGCERIIVVCSPEGRAVQDHISKTLGQDTIAIQDPPLGTGHAVRAAQDALAGFEGQLVVLYGDTPLIPNEAVEALFGVKVKAVNTTITKGKVKRFRGQLGKRKDVKKAYVTLEEGNTIDVSTGL